MSGVGPIGCLLVAALKALGAAEIVCADLSPRCPAIAGQMGPIGACMPRTTMLAIISRTRGISTSPSKWRGTRSRCSAAEITRAKGTVVQVGMGGSFPISR